MSIKTMKKYALAAIIICCMILTGCDYNITINNNTGKTGNESSTIDYSDKNNWAYYEAGDDKPADLFIICPTVDTKDEYNMSMDDETTKENFIGALNMERGIYEGSTRMFAPFYRQASLKVYGLGASEWEPYLATAYEDVSDAFSYYLENENNGRPIILAGFSQGADMCYRLLEEYFDDSSLADRLVAVYALGWPCTRELVEKYPQIKPATGATDTGVVISFDCEDPEVVETFITPAGTKSYTINPLNWKTDSTPASKEENIGACFTDYSGQITKAQRNLCGCYIDEDRGIVKVTDIDPSDYPPVIPNLPDGAYHIYDYQFFYRNLQQNVQDRINAYIQAHSPEADTIDEGVDTECMVTGYKSIPANERSYFLEEGDKIAVISPSALPSRKQVDATIEGLKDWGFEPVEGKYVCPQTRTIDELIEDFEWALSDPSIKAIFCVRGGYGASQVMDSVPLDIIKQANKPIIGYSDITVYHSAWTVSSLESVHGCMSASFTSLPTECAAAEFNMLKGRIPVYKCISSEPGIDGTAEGIMIGGNLSTFTSVLNTEYDCTKTNEPYILFIEEVGENIQHIHRYLTILKHNGVLDNASAIIFGEWTELPADGSGNFGDTIGGKYESVADMIRREFLTDIDVPVAFGFPAGHADINYPLLMGRNAQITVDGNEYTIEWQ